MRIEVDEKSPAVLEQAMRELDVLAVEVIALIQQADLRQRGGARQERAAGDEIDVVHPAAPLPPPEQVDTEGVEQPAASVLLALAKLGAGQDPAAHQADVGRVSGDCKQPLEAVRRQPDVVVNHHDPIEAPLQGGLDASVVAACVTPVLGQPNSCEGAARRRFPPATVENLKGDAARVQQLAEWL